jgi:hypothetical protein
VFIFAPALKEKKLEKRKEQEFIEGMIKEQVKHRKK